MTTRKKPCLRGIGVVLAALIGGQVAAQVADDSGQSGHDTAEDPVAAEERAFDYLLGDGVSVDPAEARRWFEQAAAAGRPISQLQLAHLYWDGIGGAGDAARAVDLFRMSAAQGVAGAQSFLGWAYLTGSSIERDYTKARKWLTAATHQGERWAMYLLGWMYRDGDGVEQDHVLADALNQRAAELGFLPAIVELLHASSDRPDAAQGLHLLRQAARADTEAAFLLGQEYLRGTNVDPEPVAAVKWISQAADAGHRLAALWQAELIAKGIGVERNEELAQEKRQAALEAATVSDKNNFCWTLAVSVDAELRNGALAVTIMEDALTNPDNRTAAYLDTLAAAYAEIGQFDKAVDAQSAAIDALAADANTAVDADFHHRIDLYRRGEAYRVSP